MYRENKDLPVTETKHPCLKLWRARIDWAEENGGFHADHRDLAARWDMCAVGEAHQQYGIEYHEDIENGPIDAKLRNLGFHFYDYVLDNQYARCRALISAIEQRLAELAR